MLFDFVMTSGKAFPAEDTIAEKVGTSVRTVRDHVQALEAGGWISRQKLGTDRGQGWRRTEYKLTWPHGRSPDTDPWLQQVEENRLRARAEFREDAGWEDGPDEVETAPEATAVPERFRHWSIDPQAWAMYVDHRAGLGRPMSEDAEYQAASKLMRLAPEDQRACVNDAIEHDRVALRHREWPPKSGTW
ncbi:hypothetical protein [uncultured Thiohalocapsa sp.]|uniref:hypothetical protein n=1 Tax=uncultured Thiohalocapsa sp. TaxID=768990 RepID=UPI0025FE57E0|nr:hypothetical protein [uncultured Thiohalocapsa sp.]